MEYVQSELISKGLTGVDVLPSAVLVQTVLISPCPESSVELWFRCVCFGAKGLSGLLP